MTLTEPSTFIGIEVRNPRTHISREKALYTDYEIVVKTNNIAFASNESSVRRRYSDFQWLRMRLINQYKLVTSPPELPPKRLFGRFQRQFLKRRQAGLQTFLERVVEDNQYLSDVAVHLFLQSSLPVKEIERYLDGMVSDGDILDTLQSPSNKKPSGLSRSMAEIPQVEAPIEHDSGFCYSTTSSINDLMLSPVTKSEGNWRYYMSVPANLDKVAGSETDLPGKGMNDVHSGRLLQVDSGHITNSSQQSLHRQPLSSESECDYTESFGYDADDESENFFKDGFVDSMDIVYHSQMFLIDQALQLLKVRPKISERILASDNDTDEEFHESEYDVIDSDNDEFLFRSRRKLSSSSKKKLSRSLSDVKLRRRPSRSNMNKEDKERRTSLQSMPDIPVHVVKRNKSSGNLRFKRLSVHREDAEKVKVNFEGFTTSGSVGKWNKSDDADESFAPNSEVDYYSTWNTSPKRLNGHVDTSEIEASLELKSRTSDVSRNLFKRIISKHEHRMYDSLSTKVSGRFKVSVIREEENISRRGSGSSNELTLKMHPLKDIQASREFTQLGRPVADAFEVMGPGFLEAPSSPVSLVASHPVDIFGKFYTERCASDSEKEEERVLISSELVNEVPSLHILAERSLRTNEGIIDEFATGRDEQQFVEKTKDSMPVGPDHDPCNEPIRTSSVDDDLAETTVDAREVIVQEHDGETDVQRDCPIVPPSIEHQQQDTTEQSGEKVVVEEQRIVHGYLNVNERNSNKRKLLSAAEAFFRDLPSSENLLNICGMNVDTYGDSSVLQLEKVRSVSPSPAILGTYDVISDVSSYVLDDYEIVSDKRE